GTTRAVAPHEQDCPETVLPPCKASARSPASRAPGLGIWPTVCSVPTSYAKPTQLTVIQHLTDGAWVLEKCRGLYQYPSSCRAWQFQELMETAQAARVAFAEVAEQACQQKTSRLCTCRAPTLSAVP